MTADVQRDKMKTRKKAPERTRPNKPKNPREDRRWTDDEELGWPISHKNFERWARGRYWQFARTMP